MTEKATLVIGVSLKPDRYSNMAVNRLVAHRHKVYAIGHKPGNVAGVQIVTDKPDLKNIDTVTLYINPSYQPEYYSYILSLKPRRIIFNPGAENPEFEEMAIQNNIKALEACTLVMLNTGQF